MLYLANSNDVYKKIKYLTFILKTKPNKSHRTTLLNINTWEAEVGSGVQGQPLLLSAF